jgi:[protein-PII] uridylyltransferase
MRTLLAKIEADAAERLPLPPGRTLEQEKARYRQFLKVESHRLKILHRGGGSGAEVCRGRAAMMDELLRYLMDAIHHQAGLEFQRQAPALSLVATGGYGRGELNPCSDIDIMLLHTGEASGGQGRKNLAAIIDMLVPMLWDVHLKPGHAVRSVTDCVEIANKDMQSKTSLIEARPIWGNFELFKLFQETLGRKCVDGFEDQYIAARVRDQAERHAKFGNSATMQEPNIKNGCGGLRDYQNLLWMAFFKYRTRTTADLVKKDLITPAEARQLEAAYDFLLRARNELHYLVNRPVDVLSKSVQPAVARNLGYTERSPSRRIEQFLSEYYHHSRHIFLITRTVEQRLALLPQPSRLPSIRAMIRQRLDQMKQQMLDGFKLLNGEIHAGSPHVFKDQPARLMRVFLYAQQRGLKLQPDLMQLIRRELRRVDRAFLCDPHVRETFLEILNQRGSVAPILRLMHEVGFLGKYLPEFGRLTALVQHEFYHQYTADEHTLVCLEKLDRVQEATAAPFCHYAEMFRNLERPFLLYLALLLHDSGKSRPSSDHTRVGVELAQKVARRLQLDVAAAASLRLVIENHLVMAQVSQRRDLDDAEVIQDFAGLVQNPENLALLTLHTFADSMGTSDQLWNGFKDTSLLTLYERTRQALMGGAEVVEADERLRVALRTEVERLAPRAIAEDEMEAHFTALPPRYFKVNTAREIAADVTLAHEFMCLHLAEDNQSFVPALEWENEADRGYTRVKVGTWDRPGLFWRIAGCFAAAGINILGAQIFSRTDGIALDTFFVVDGAAGTFVKREAREEFGRLLPKVLELQPIDLPALIARKKPARPLYQPFEGEGLPTRIEFDNRTSAHRTVIEIETEDRLGLLYGIAQVLAELGLDISVAKIVTEKGAAIDSFYVREPDGQKVLTEERQQLIGQRLRAAIAALDKGIASGSPSPRPAGAF